MPRLFAIALLALGLLGCAALRPALGLCHDGISKEQLAEATAAREFTDASFAKALERQGLTRIHPEYTETHESDFHEREDGVFEHRYSELTTLTPDAEPVFARDAHGVVHLVIRQPNWIFGASYRQCDCEPGYDKGITPGDIVRRYRVGALGSRLTVSYDAKSVTFPKPMCPRTGPPKA